MSIHVKFFARLREELQLDEIEIDAAKITDILSVWQSATGRETIPEGVFCAINQEHAKAKDAVNDADEVAFFPRITGG